MLTPSVMPISSMRKYQAKVMAELKQRPVVFTQRGHGIAVLISIEQWELLMERLEDLEDALTMLEARMEDTDEPSVPLDQVLKELGLEARGGCCIALS